MYFELSKQQFLVFLANNLIVEAYKGGFVKGPLHSHGGIKIFQAHLNISKFFCIGEMEGGEFVVNHLATAKHEARLKEINEYKGPYQAIDETIENIRIMNTPPNHVLLFSTQPQMIVNRAATAKHLDELIRINESTIDEIEQMIASQ